MPRATAQNPSRRQPTQSDLKALDAYTRACDLAPRRRLETSPPTSAASGWRRPWLFDVVRASGQIGNVRLSAPLGHARFSTSPSKPLFARIRPTPAPPRPATAIPFP